MPVEIYEEPTSEEAKAERAYLRRLIGFALCALLLIGLTGGALKACAQEARSWVVLSVGSYHLDRSEEYREINPGLGLEFGMNDRWSLVAGVYNNSFGRASEYAGATYMPWQWRAARFGTVMGLVTGYESRPVPVVLPALSIEGTDFGVNVVVSPKHGDSPGGLGFQLKWRFR